MSSDKSGSTPTGHTLWGGRFSEATDAFVEAFTASVSFDQRLYRHDIAGSHRPRHACWPRSAC